MKRILAVVGFAVIFCQFAFAEEAQTTGKETMVQLKKATLAGGCFWCMDPPFSKLKGVKEVIVGYTGGRTLDPTYEEVSSGNTGHYEAAEVVYDPAQVNYEDILDVFWRNIDPTNPDGQFVDEGPQYRSAIFYHNDEEKRLAEESKKALEASKRFNKPIVTEIIPAATFYPAEQYHQGFCRINPTRYKSYSAASGREQFLNKIWGKDRIK